MRHLPLRFAALFAFLAAPSARAAVFQVTKTADTFDGACDADCSLREAVRAADDVYPEAHTILVPAGTYALTRAGTGEDGDATGDLDIATNVTFIGAGRDATVIDGGGIDRVFHIYLPTDRRQDIVFKHLTIQGGDVLAFDIGGGLHIVGNFNSLKVRVFDCVIQNNKGARGGGVVNTGDFTITDSIVRGNTASAQSGGLEHPSLVRRSVIEDNHLTFAYGDGGGLTAGAPTTIEDSLLRGNQAGTATGSGGGIAGGGLGSLVVRNVTIAGNTAGPGRGGGIAVGGGLLENVTLADNVGGATLVVHSAALQLRNTLISGNACSVPPGGAYFPPVSLGHNLEVGNGVDTGHTCNLADPTDHVDVPDAMLGALADNGGPTETRALLAGSPAIGAGDPANCPPADQRGFPRADGACDVGAYEAGAPAAPICATGELQEVVDDFSLRAVGCVVLGLRGAAGLL